MRPGQVSGVRELTGHRGLGTPRVQAQVCLGATVKDGYAVITVETDSKEVMDALDQLKVALQRDARRFVANVLEGQPAWKEKP